METGDNHLYPMNNTSQDIPPQLEQGIRNLNFVTMTLVSRLLAERLSQMWITTLTPEKSVSVLPE